MKKANQISITIMTVVFVLLSITGQAQDTTAVSGPQFCIVNLTNGTKVSGALINQSHGTITVVDPILGQLSIQEANIESMKVAETGKEYTFTMASGNKYQGVIESQTANSIILKEQAAGSITLNTINISGFSEPGVLSELAERFDHGSRYLFAPSAIPLRKGEGYYQNIWILMNGFQYGVNDHFSIGGGIIAPIGFYGTMKYGRQVGKNVHVAAGGMMITTLMGIGVGVGCGFGSVTIGDRWTNATFTAGMGAVMSDGYWEATKRPILNFSAMARVSDNFSLITENYFIPRKEWTYEGGGQYTTGYTYRPQLSAGFRIGGGKHTFDLAATTIGDITDGELFVIPYFAYAYRFQVKKNKTNQ